MDAIGDRAALLEAALHRGAERHEQIAATFQKACDAPRQSVNDASVAKRTETDGDVGEQILDPIHRLPAARPRAEQRYQCDQRRIGEADEDAAARRAQYGECRTKHVTRIIGEPATDRRTAEARSGDARDPNARVRLAARQRATRRVARVARYHSNVPTGIRQIFSEIGEHLARRGNVGPVEPVEKDECTLTAHHPPRAPQPSPPVPACAARSY